MDLNNWIRKDGNYKGFAKPGTDTSLPEWCILKDDETTLRDWADNDTSQDKIWDDRVAYFSAPSVAPTLISSGVTENGELNTLYAEWSYVSGVTKYYVTVLDTTNKAVLPWNNTRIKINPDNKIIFRDTFGSGTYTVKLIGKNGKGEISTQFTVTI